MKRRSRKISGGVLSLVVVLVLARMALPFGVKWYVNRTLDRLPDYDGHIGDVDMNLYRGAYEIEDIEIVKTAGDVPVPLFKAEKVDLAIQWRELRHKALVGEMVLKKPEVNFVASPEEKDQQTGKEQNWTEVVAKLFPVKINRLEVKEGKVHYRDFNGEPQVDVVLSSFNAVAKNLTNSAKVSQTLTADMAGNANVLNTGNVIWSGQFDPYEKNPAFDFNLQLSSVPLTELNGFFRHYADIDVQRGTLSMYVEAAAKDGRMVGYAKPFLSDLDVMDLKHEKLTLTQKVKEGAVELVGKIFKNDKTGTTATRIPFSVALGDTRVGVWPAIESSLHHILIHALRPTLEDTIGVQNGRLEDKTS